MSKIIIHVDDGIPDSRALQVVSKVMDMGMISVAHGNKGHMQYCYHTTVYGLPVIEVSATRLRRGTHVFRVWERASEE